MARFLIFYFVAYGGAHLYFYLKTKRAIAFSKRSRLLLAAVLCCLFISPLAARTLESSGLSILPEILSNSGYLWMGLLFLFITASSVLELTKLVISGAASKTDADRLINPLRHFALAATYTVIIGIHGYYEAYNIKTEYLEIFSSRIPANIPRIRIVQLSDVHAGQIVRERRIKRILGLVQAASPDLLVSTGDLVDGYQRHLNGLEKLFLDITPRLGKYAILGNHEYYVGQERSVKFMRDAGFKTLINENFELGGIVCITGTDDSHDQKQRSDNALIEQKLLLRTEKGVFRLLLKHRPVVAPDSAGKFDLQLSGHTHKGQIFPFNFFTWLNFRVKSGLTKLDTGHYLYVSRGTGVWGPPIRFLAPPEITVIDLRPETKIK